MFPELKEKLESARRLRVRKLVFLELVLFTFVLLLVGVFFYAPESAPLVFRIVSAAFGIGFLFLMLYAGRIILGPDAILDVIENRPSFIKEVLILPRVDEDVEATLEMSLCFLLEDGTRLVLTDRCSTLEPMVPLLKRQLPNADFKTGTSH